MKKFLSACILFTLVCNLITPSIEQTFASFEASSFLLNTLDNPSYSLNPGDTFKLNTIATSNNFGEIIKNVSLNLSFTDNSQLSYSQTSTKGQYGSINEIKTSNCASSTWSNVSGMVCEITNASHLTIANGVPFSFLALSNAGFFISPTAKNYVQMLSTHFEAKKNTDGTPIIGPTLSRALYINVKPHITDYTFSKSSVVGNGIDSVDLTVKVKDYNGCGNIDGGIVTANMTNLGLSSAENLTYNSCDVDGKTAIFKKTSITTLAITGDKTFSSTSFTAKDEDNNITDPTDPNTTFDDEDKKTDAVLTVVTPNAPVVTIISLNPSTVSTQDSTVSFSATQTGSYKVVLNGDGICSAGTIITDWTSYDPSGITISSLISAALINSEANTIYACVKNAVGDIGSANTTITKDTTAPIISNITVDPANVVTNDSSTSFVCSENGTYKVVMNGLNTGYFTTTGSTTNTVTLPNANISVGANTITLYCRDTAGNEANATTTVSKVALPPAMSASGLILTDNDIGWDGVDGRDIQISWDSVIGSTYSGFESYRIYILPQNTAFTGTYLGLVSDSGATTWTGSSSILSDSAGNPLSGGNYVAYVAIMGASGQIGGTASATGTLVADVIPHPSVLSASFTATGNLRVKFDTNLKVDISAHSATGFTYQVGATTYTGVSVSSISGDSINIAIADLGSTSATGTLIVMSGAAWGVPVDGSFNYGTGGVLITDTINPVITNFSTGTTAYYNNYYTGSVIFNYTLSENLAGGGDTNIIFTRVGGNADTTKTHPITIPANLASGSHSETINLSSLGLVSGVYYDTTLVAKDLAGNITTSAPVSIKFDRIGPSILSLVPFGPQGIQGVVNPTFTWLTTTDNSGNGSGVKGYKLRVYTGSTTYTNWHFCTGSYTENDISSGSILSQQITLANLYNYAWSVLAYDNMENVGTSSSCDTFYINTNVPSFSLSSITDTVLGSTNYTKGGNTLVIRSTITNTDSGHIWLAAPSIKDSSYANISCASPVSGATCTYASNIVTYTFSNGALGSLSSGVKQVQFTATNNAGINTGTTLASITLDNTAPVIAASTILSPLSGIYGGSGITISWTAPNITDNIGISYVKLDYTSDGTSWNLVGTGANSGTYPWNITALTSGASYQVRISAYDGVGQSALSTGTVFSIDKVAPIVSSSTLIYPSVSDIKVKGGSAFNITWNTGSITDNIGLAANPITLSYSTDGGANYTQIATSLSNNGTYLWTVPEALNNATMKIKIEALDNVGNTANDTSDNIFEVDSTLPIVNVTYAGNGGSTPGTNSYINNSGFDISANISDENLSGGTISFSLFDQTSNKYWNGTVYSGSVEIWNTLSTATGSTYNLASTIASSISNGDFYKLKLQAHDNVGNSTTTSQVTFVGDTINPTLALTTASGTYFSGVITLAGSSSDTGSTISSVSIEVQKGATWWNGTTWVGTQQLLSTTTANSYANWSYNFNPSSDSSGQDYTVTFHAYDKAYKTNNTSTGMITITKDTSGPTIAAGIFTNVISGIQKDGNIINLTWNTGSITSTGSLINPNSFVLKFNNGAGIITITGATANDGSYDYVLPTGDTQNAFFVMEAYDMLGNISNTVTSSGFSLDSTPPTISSVETIEDTLGQINGINIYLSELIAHGSITLSDFSIPGVSGMQTGAISDVGSGTIFAINFTSTGTTATLPSITYTLGNLTDLSGKPLATVTKSSLDKARPVILSADIYDTNSNGKIDRIIANVSESLIANTNISSWIINNPLPGVSISSVGISGNTVELNLIEPTSPDTSTGDMTLSFFNNSSWKDSANNLVSNTISPLALSDKAPPIILSAVTKDNDTNSKMDTILLTFSEGITGAVGNNFSVTGLSTGTIFSNSITSSGNTIALNITETTSDNDTGITPSYSYSGVSVKDTSNNTLSNIVSTAAFDGIKPKLMSRTTLDQDANGYIDTLKMLWSETISGTGGITVAVGGYSVNGYNLCGGIGLCVSVDEKALYDGDGTPTLQIMSNSTLADTAGNQVNIEDVPTTSTDTVGPIIIGARYDAGATGGVSDDIIYLTFSESLSGATIDTINATTDFNILAGGSLTSATVSNISGNTAEIHLGASSTALSVGTSLVSIKTGAISDILSNVSPSEGVNNRVTVNASIIINEVMFSTTVANQYIELRNLGSTSVSLSGWTITNAGVITIPSGASIAGNGYYLIANTGSANSILSGTITPDFIDTSLNLSPTNQSNLLLKNAQNVTFDSAKASPWPAGSGALNIAMERVNFPGDGLLGSNWYSSVVSVGFDDSIPKGTPGSSNVFDSTAPIISSVNVTDNTLFPLGNITLVYNYSDNIAIDTLSRTFTLEKWNGASWSGVTVGNISSSGITISQASYNTNTLTFGKYRSTFTISDTSGNTATELSIFYVDKLEMTVSTGSINIGVLPFGSLAFATQTVTVTIKTVGAGFNLSLGGSDTMSAGVAQMAAWSGTTGKGYGFDWSESGSGTIKALTGTLNAIAPTTIGSYTFSPDINGNQKTYTYTIKYGAKIDSSQTAGIYQSLTNFGLSPQY